MIRPGDTFEVFEDATIYSANPVGPARSRIVINAKEGDLVTYTGITEFHNKTMYRFLFTPVDEFGDPVNIEHEFFVRNMKRFLESIGYEVEEF